MSTRGSRREDAFVVYVNPSMASCSTYAARAAKEKGTFLLPLSARDARAKITRATRSRRNNRRGNTRSKVSIKKEMQRGLLPHLLSYVDMVIGEASPPP